MPDTRKHRGKHPSDDKLFNPGQLIKIREALSDINYLLSRGYNSGSALKIVGDRYKLQKRQRLVLAHNACSDQSFEKRMFSQVTQTREGDLLLIDGYNYLITLEAAFSGAYIFKGRDGCFRDISGVHGSYRRVQETEPALMATGWYLKNAGLRAMWLFDSPVSNSGRLASFVKEMAVTQGWDWDAAVSMNPDKAILDLRGLSVSSDSYVLDNSTSWFNLPECIFKSLLPGLKPLVIDLTIPVR